MTPAQIKAQEKAARKAAAAKARQEFEAATLAAFASAGFKNLKVRETIRTPRLWQEAGFAPKVGERPLLVPAPWSSPGSGYVMFHRSQVEPIKAVA